ncbi:MAG: hypothetical protein F4Y99_02835 [Acidimicrobiaceae bacterium]|nr:hypothetical protein [Acidimicrobiaceae bacterium]MYF43337.1 hypothetical protein [Acidimicrobiaceae bacterium]MYJ36407.1 hypothetical protein [Acidimicrobiaceae bacterium]
MAELGKLIAEARSIDVGQASWLLEASTLSRAICETVLSDPTELASVQHAVKKTAEQAGCDWIVGASPAADRVVRELNLPSGQEPSRALLFELVRVTGATFARAQQELLHVDVVPAVFVDVNPSSRPGAVLEVGGVGPQSLGS